MKTLSTHIAESLLTGNVRKPSAKTQPSSKEELQQIIDEHIKRIKPRPEQEVDFNWIDISGVDDLSRLFNGTVYIPVIDKWNIDHVKDFSFMFADNGYITRSPLPVLQKKLLAPECYRGMFWGCTALEVPPELPAKQLMFGCYSNLFRQCRSLKRAPQLPAKQLGDYCYSFMFAECSSLEEAPALPATKLNIFCYNCMFSWCLSLQKAPKLPAKTLVHGCYNRMFEWCSDLEKAPQLPAKTDHCCVDMFSCCDKLQK